MARAPKYRDCSSSLFQRAKRSVDELSEFVCNERMLQRIPYRGDVAVASATIVLADVKRFEASCKTASASVDPNKYRYCDFKGVKKARKNMSRATSGLKASGSFSLACKRTKGVSTKMESACSKLRPVAPKPIEKRKAKEEVAKTREEVRETPRHLVFLSLLRNLTDEAKRLGDECSSSFLESSTKTLETIKEYEAKKAISSGEADIFADELIRSAQKYRHNC